MPLWQASPSLTRPLLQDVGSIPQDIAVLPTSSAHCKPTLPNYAPTQPIDIYPTSSSSTSLLTRLLSADQEHPPTTTHHAPATPTLTIHSPSDGEEGILNAQPQPNRWGLPMSLWRSTSRRAWLGTTTHATCSVHEACAAVPPPIEQQAPRQEAQPNTATGPHVHPPTAPPSTSASSTVDEPTDSQQPPIPPPWWSRAGHYFTGSEGGLMVSTAPRVDAMADHAIACHQPAETTNTRGALYTDTMEAAWQQAPTPGTALWLELKDGMGWWLMACAAAQMALMWYISSGLLSRNTAGLVLLLLLSSGNVLGFLGALLFLWYTPTAAARDAHAPPSTGMVLVAMAVWLLAALSCVGAVLAWCVGLGLVLVIDADAHLVETYQGGWAVAAYLVLPPPVVTVCSAGAAIKSSRLVHWGGCFPRRVAVV